MMITLGHLKVKAVDILDIYVVAQVMERAWAILGHAFEGNEGKVATVFRAID